LVSPTPAASPTTQPIGGIDFTCVLPVYGYGGLSTGAFISFPSGSMTAATEGGHYYDRAISRWVPVYRQAVSPDGRRYAYTEGWSADPPLKPKVYVIDAASGSVVRTAAMPDAQPYQIADYTTSGVYLVISFEGTAPGVRLMDPATGAVTKTSSGYYTPAGAAWIGVVDPRDPHPYVSPFSGQMAPDRIDRRDDVGRTTMWFYAPGYGLMWVGFAGSPALLVYGYRQDTSAGPTQEAYWLVDAPGHAIRVTTPGSSFSSGFGGAIADSHGIWMNGPDSLYLVRRDGSVVRAFDGSVYPANGCF
jgi:hypothetical protein